METINQNNNNQNRIIIGEYDYNIDKQLLTPRTMFSRRYALENVRRYDDERVSEHKRSVRLKNEYIRI